MKMGRRQINVVNQIPAQHVGASPFVLARKSAKIVEGKDFGLAKRNLSRSDRPCHRSINFYRSVARGQTDAETRIMAKAIAPQADNGVDPGFFGIELEEIHRVELNKDFIWMKQRSSPRYGGCSGYESGGW
jgi:hypothetical protein